MSTLLLEARGMVSGGSSLEGMSHLGAVVCKAYSGPPRTSQSAGSSEGALTSRSMAQPRATRAKASTGLRTALSYLQEGAKYKEDQAGEEDTHREDANGADMPSLPIHPPYRRPEKRHHRDLAELDP